MMHDVKLIPHTIAEIIKDLKYSGHKEREDLDAFSFDTRNDQVYFILTGEGEFQWPIERRMEVNWTAWNTQQPFQPGNRDEDLSVIFELL